MAKQQHHLPKDLGFTDEFWVKNAHIESVRRSEFKRLKDVTYLDHAGTTLYSETQLEKYYRDLTTNVYGNPHSGNQSSRLTSDLVAQARYRVLRHFNTNPDEYTVIFTSGCTAALKLVAESFSFRALTPKHDSQPDLSGAKAESQTTNGKDSIENDSQSPGGGSYCDSTCTHPTELHTTQVAHQTTQVAHQTTLGGHQTTQDKPPSSGAPYGRFYYLEDSHTSVVGMREITRSRGVSSECVMATRLQEEISQNPSLDTSAQLPWKPESPSSLFVFPAQSNYSGHKYPLSWIRQFPQTKCGCHGNCAVLLDAASFVTTSELDLGLHRPEFVTISFYKMFGFPTGLGALLVRNDAAPCLTKTYFGGGTVQMALAAEDFHVHKDNLSDRFEDGSLPFLDIVALKHGFDALNRIAGPMSSVRDHTFSLARYIYSQLSHMTHSNGHRMAALYHDSHFLSPECQGAIVNFNLLRDDGTYIGYAEVDKLAQAHDIHLRTGCFCNLGACQRHLKLSPKQVKDNLKAGHVCGDDMDLIDGQPTGSIRVSLGYMSTLGDCHNLLQFIADCFAQGSTVKYSQDIGECGGREQDMGKCGGREQAYITSVREEERGMPQTTTGGEERGLQPPSRDFGGESIGVVVSKDERKHSGQIDTDGESKMEPNIPLHIKETLPSEQTILVPHNTTRGQQTNTNPATDVLLTGKLREGVATQTKPTTSALPQTTESEPDVHTQGTRTPTHCGRGTRLKNIFLYPIKSCGAFQTASWTLSHRGLMFDREWMVVSESGVCLTQKREPRLCRIKPHIDLKTELLTLSMEDLESISIPLRPPAQVTMETSLCESKVCGDRVSGQDCGGAVAEWLGRAMDRPGVRLVRQTLQDGRVSRRKALGESGYSATRGSLSLANEAQYLLISESSIRALSDHLTETYGAIQDVDKLVERFRANLVVSGGEAFSEEEWIGLGIGQQRFVSQGPCNRCQMICIDQQTGDRNKVPLLGLTTFRNKKSTFGILLRHQPSDTRPARLSVGDIIATRE